MVEKLDKAAFVYVAGEDHYRCPAGEILQHRGQTTEREYGHDVVRHRYESDAEICKECPLMTACVSMKTGRRQVRHTEHEAARIEHAEKMSTEEA
ncbi:MAG: transposase [Planctomycetota bacterium]